MMEVGGTSRKRHSPYDVACLQSGSEDIRGPV